MLGQPFCDRLLFLRTEIWCSQYDPKWFILPLQQQWQTLSCATKTALLWLSSWAYCTVSYYVLGFYFPCIQPSGSCCKYLKAKLKDVVNTQPNCWYAAKWWFKLFWCWISARRTRHPSSKSGKGLKIKLQLPIMSNITGHFFGGFSHHSFLKALTSKLPYPGKKSSRVISRRCL